MSWAMLAYWESLLVEMTMRDMMLWYDLHRLQERYVNVIDTDRLEQWPDLFTEDCVYEIIPGRNVDQCIPATVMRCCGRSMLRERITSLRAANASDAHKYRHLISGLDIAPVNEDMVDMQSNYVVLQTLADGELRVYQSGRYFDRVQRMADGWRYQLKRAIYDTSRVQTMSIAPI